MEQGDDGPRFKAVTVSAGGEVSSVQVLAARLVDEVRAELGRAGVHDPSESHSLGEIVHEWLGVIRPKRVEPKNEVHLSQHLLPLFLEDELSLTTATIDDLFEALKGKLSNSTINKVRNVGRRSIDRAISARRWIAPNPFDESKRLPEGDVDFQELTLEELNKIQKALRPDRRLQFRVMLHLGLRTGELFALRKEDIDFAAGSITIHRSHARDKTKTDKVRVVPILPAIAEDLAQAMMAAPGDIVFGKYANGQLQRRDTKMARVIRTAMVKAGVGIKTVVYKCRRCGQKEELPPPIAVNICSCGRKRWPVPKPIKFTWYTLRHMSATLHSRYGADPLTAAICLGWSLKPFGMIAKYTHPNIEDKRRELSKWALPRDDSKQMEMFTGRATVQPVLEKRKLPKSNSMESVDVVTALDDLLGL